MCYPICESCQIIKGIKKPVSNILLDLKGGWVLNHFSGGTRNILGRLVLMTKEHKEDLSTMNSELSMLGENLKNVDGALRLYWHDVLKDPIEHIYILSFNETKPCHFHFHLFPRSEGMKCKADCHNVSSILGWEYVRLLDNPILQGQYQIVEQNQINEPKVEALMQFLQEQLK